MKFGHHGANHPVQELKSNRVLITSQNHGFAVSEEAIPENIEVTHRSLFDKTIQGIKLRISLHLAFKVIQRHLLDLMMSVCCLMNLLSRCQNEKIHY